MSPGMIRERSEILSGLPGFRCLGSESRRLLGGALRVEDRLAGDVIFREGDEGDRLFVIDSGRAEVSSRGAQGMVCVLATLGRGEVFGELALLSGECRRQATVTALEPLRLFSLEGDVFRRILAAEPDFRADLIAATDDLLVAKFLKQASPFSVLDPARLRALSGRLGRKRAEAGEVIVREGDAGADACYLVRSGRVEVLLGEGSGEARQLTTLEAGMLFGESALLTGAPRNATVRALEPTELLTLRRADLLEVMAATPGISAQVLGMHALRARPRRMAGVEAHHRKTAEGESITVLKKSRDGTYFQLSEQGWFVWERLDGSHTLRDLTLDLLIGLKVFSPDSIVELIGRLAAAGFVEARSLRSDVASPVALLPAWQRFLLAVPRWLTWQCAWNGLDPFFTRLHRAGLGLLFTPFAVSALAALAAAGLVAGALHRGEWVEALMGVGPEAWAFLLPGLVFSVIVHELGHGLAVKSFGREVPRVGFGWHWVAPMVFVDTSDIWLADRWPRVAVSLAGPFANLVLAGAAAGTAVVSGAGAAVLWPFAAINILIVLFNLSPVLELDGYYTLMDLLQQPSLRSRALQWLRRPRLVREHRAEVIYFAASVLHIGVVIWIVREFLAMS